MHAVLQRVSQAQVTVDGRCVGSIGPGLLIFLGIEQADTEEEGAWLVKKSAHMRLFADAEGKMNLSLLERGGEVLVVSQFTLHASTKKGNRPSFLRAAAPQRALPLYEAFIREMEKILGREVATGEFGATMQISLINDGPVTITIDSKNRQ